MLRGTKTRATIRTLFLHRKNIQTSKGHRIEYIFKAVLRVAYTLEGEKGSANSNIKSSRIRKSHYDKQIVREG